MTQLFLSRSRLRRRLWMRCGFRVLRTTTEKPGNYGCLRKLSTRCLKLLNQMKPKSCETMRGWKWKHVYESICRGIDKERERRIQLPIADCRLPIADMLY